MQKDESIAFKHLKKDSSDKLKESINARKDLVKKISLIRLKIEKNEHGSFKSKEAAQIYKWQLEKLYSSVSETE